MIGDMLLMWLRLSMIIDWDGVVNWKTRSMHLSCRLEVLIYSLGLFGWGCHHLGNWTWGQFPYLCRTYPAPIPMPYVIRTHRTCLWPFMSNMVQNNLFQQAVRVSMFSTYQLCSCRSSRWTSLLRFFCIASQHCVYHASYSFDVGGIFSLASVGGWHWSPDFDCLGLEVFDGMNFWG